MKKTISLILALIVISALLVSCGSPAELKCTTDELIAKISAVNAEGDLFPFDSDRIQFDMGIASDNYSEGFILVPIESAGVETIAFFTAKDSSSASLIAEKLNTYINDTRNYQKDYNADNYKVSLSAEVYTEGNYVYMIMSSAKAEIKKIIDENLK